MTKTGHCYASSDQVFPTLVRELLPSGIRGLVAGGLLAALMSSLSSVFNSCSTLFTMDIYKKLYPETGEKKLVLVGRMATAIVVLSGIMWIPFIKVVSGAGYNLSPKCTSIYCTSYCFCIFAWPILEPNKCKWSVSCFSRWIYGRYDSPRIGNKKILVNGIWNMVQNSRS